MNSIVKFLKSGAGFISHPTHSRTMGIVAMFVLVAAVSLTVIVAQQQQNIRQRASEKGYVLCGTGLTCDAATVGTDCSPEKNKCLAVSRIGIGYDTFKKDQINGRSLACCNASSYCNIGGECTLTNVSPGDETEDCNPPTSLTSEEYVSCDSGLACEGTIVSSSCPAKKPTKCLSATRFGGDKINGKSLVCCNASTAPTTETIPECEEGLNCNKATGKNCPSEEEELCANGEETISVREGEITVPVMYCCSAPTATPTPTTSTCTKSGTTCTDKLGTWTNKCGVIWKDETETEIDYEYIVTYGCNEDNSACKGTEERCAEGTSCKVVDVSPSCTSTSTLTPTLTPTPTPTPTQTPGQPTPTPTSTSAPGTSTSTPTPTPTQTPIPPTSTPALGDTIVELPAGAFNSLFTNTKNIPELIAHKDQSLTIYLYQSTVDPSISDPSGAAPAVPPKTITLASSGTDSTSFNLGKVTPGTYKILLKGPKYLRTLVATKEISAAGGTIALDTLSKTLADGAGDINNDNIIDIRDYNAIANCFGEKKNTSTCIYKEAADLNDDDIIDQLDYNIFLTSLSFTTREGD